MSLGKPVVHVEGRTTCTFECQYEEFKKENDLLRKALLDMSGYISRADMYYLKPETLIALKEKE